MQGNPQKRGDVLPVDIARYYHDLTYYYMRYAKGTLSWHFGIWDSGVRNQAQALVRANERLCEGVKLASRSQVLDVGCGVGGFAVWAAQKFGCRVTGITLSAEHASYARKLALRHDVAERCDFAVMGMDSLAFRSKSFDVIFNQETYLHASNKRSYPGERGLKKVPMIPLADIVAFKTSVSNQRSR